MTTISIIQTTNNGRGDAILKGVFGQAGPIPEDGGQREFTISPEFSRMSVIFSNLNSLPIPIGQSAMLDLEVDDKDVADIKNQLVLTLAARWKNLYNVTGMGSAVIDAMLRAESAGVSNAVKAYFDEQGASIWAVPVTAEMSSFSYGYELRNSNDVLQSLSINTIANLRLAENAAPTPVSEVPNLAEDREVAQEIVDVSEGNPQWYEFDGLTAEVGATINIVARDADHARAVVATLAADPALLKGLIQSQGLIVQPKQVITVREMHAQDQIVEAGSTELGATDTAAPSIGMSTGADEANDSGLDDDDDDMNPRATFRF